MAASTAAAGKVILYTGTSSSSSWRVRICLALKGIPFEPIWIDAKKGGPTNGFTPMGQVPVLEIDGIRITQSVAICEYLEETRPTGMLPHHPWKRARVREVVETINSGIQPLQNAPVVAMIGDEVAQQKWVTHFITKGLAALEQLAVSNGSHDLLFSWADRPTLAEVFLVPQVYNAKRYGIDLNAYPHVNRIFAYLMKTVEGFQKTVPPPSKL